MLVAQSFPALCNPMDCNPPASCVQEIFQARVLEWGAITFSEGALIDSHNCPKCLNVTCKNSTEPQEGYAELNHFLDGKNRIGKPGGARVVKVRISFPVTGLFAK